MERVGWRVQVFWEGEAEWFEGIVAAYSPDEGFFVTYDDGEEQWEDASGETPIRFLSGPEVDGSGRALSIAADDDEQQQQRGGKWSQQPPPSSAYTDGDYADDDDDDDEGEQEAAAVALKKSPTPEDDGSPIAKLRSKAGAQAAPSLSPQQNRQPKNQQQQQQPRKATLYVNNAVFFRDEESLREMRKALQMEKKMLAHEHQTLAKQLAEKEQLSTSLKRELGELKTQVTLASVLGHAPMNSASVPKTSSDWSERVLDQKLQNKQTKHELAELRACVQQKQHAIQQREQEREQLKDKLARVPRRDLCTLVDLQVEIATLLEEKRALEALKPKSLAPRPTRDRSDKADAGNGTFGWTNDADARKVALEKERSRLELACSRAKDEIHKWKLSFERENARILPLKARQISLQQELAKFETSNVLLRSAFLRLSPDAEGRVSAQTAAEALLALAPSDASSPFTSSEAIVAALKRQRLLASESQQQLAFADFVACFNSLFTS